MHPTVMAQRIAAAQDQAVKAAAIIVERDNIEVMPMEHTRYREYNAMLTWERLASILEIVANTQPRPRVGEIVAIPGLSKTSIKAIQKHYGITPGVEDDSEDGDPN